MHPTIDTALARIAAREAHDRAAFPPLYEAVDPDAVASVLGSNADVFVRFEYACYRIVTGPDDVGAVDEQR